MSELPGADKIWKCAQSIGYCHQGFLFFQGKRENPGNEVDAITDFTQDSSAAVCFGTQNKNGENDHGSPKTKKPN